jgi:hypothetical protein
MEALARFPSLMSHSFVSSFSPFLLPFARAVRVVPSSLCFRFLRLARREFPFPFFFFAAVVSSWPRAAVCVVLVVWVRGALVVFLCVSE